MEFWFVRVVPRYLTCSTVSNDLLYVPILSCVLISRHDHILTFLSIHSKPISLLAISKTSVFFLIVCNSCSVTFCKERLCWISYKCERLVADTRSRTHERFGGKTCFPKRCYFLLRIGRHQLRSSEAQSLSEVMIQQYRQCMHNVILRRFRESLLPWKSNN
jgi:hypothetical protein